MRVDSHVHCFPDRLALAVRGRLQRDGLLTAGALLPDLAESVRAAGFDRAWVLPYAHRPGVAESVNEWSAAEVPKFPWLVPGATFHPADERFEELVRRGLVELRLRVVKLHCSVGQFSPADPRLEPLWRGAAELRVPVVVHAGQRDGGSSAEDEVDEVISVLERHPQLPLVLAHCGYPNPNRALALMERFPNLYADITPVWTNEIGLPVEVLERFAGRLLFGSDAPNNPMAADDYARRVDVPGLSDSARAMLFGDAAAALVPREA